MTAAAGGSRGEVARVDESSDTWDAQTPTICMAVPGLWPDRETIVRQVLQESGRQFAVLGNSLYRAADLNEFPFDLIEHDPVLANTFFVGGRGRIPNRELEQIGRHTFTLYLRGEGGSPDAAREMMDAATALMRAGGLGVKVESSGTAVGRDEWFLRADPTQPAGPYWVFVALIRGHERGAYSCGMHNFGLRDAITNIVIDPEPLAALVHNFLGLSYQTRPVMEDGDEFSDGDTGIVYRVRAEPCTTFPAGHMQHNPYGMWRLELVEPGEEET